MDTKGVKSVQPQASHRPFRSAACRLESHTAWRLPQGFSLLLTVRHCEPGLFGTLRVGHHTTSERRLALAPQAATFCLVF